MSRSSRTSSNPIDHSWADLSTKESAFRWIGLLLCMVFASGPASAQDNKSQGQHDMLLLLPDGPIHLRLSVVDGESSFADRRREYLERLVKTLDTDQDGQLNRAETTKHPLFVTGRRFDDNPFLQSRRPRKPYTQKELETVIERAAGQLVSYRQENAIADQDLNVFRVLDQDESGLIDAAEMRLAASRIAARDLDLDQCVTFDEFLTTAAAPTSVNMVTLNDDSDAPGSVHSELLRDAREPTMPARLVRKYDKDRDAHLVASELGWEADRLKLLDDDSDGRLNMQELGQVYAAQPDAYFEVDLCLDRNVGGGLRLVKDVTASRLTDNDSVGEDNFIIPAKSSSSDISTFDTGASHQLTRNHAILKIGYRHRDPLEEARQNALTAFNAIDADLNGYLDKDEVAEHQRFARYLFDAMDRDGDQRVFATEMLTYVNEYTEPASTTCQVTLFDMGNGFFPMLDENGDGRISIRELRHTESLLRSAADAKGLVNPSSMRRSYRIEIQRGGVSLFGKVFRMTAEAPVLSMKPLSGPIWYQRMDRNGDGDVTWDEFLGPREAFHQIDSDQDGLIDAAEASAYKPPNKP